MHQLLVRRGVRKRAPRGCPSGCRPAGAVFAPASFASFAGVGRGPPGAKERPEGGRRRDVSSRARGDEETVLPVSSARAGGASDDGGGGGATAACRSFLAFLRGNYFLLGMLGGVAAASAAPWIGCTGGPLRPEFTVNKVAVRAMFLISGLNLPLGKLRDALTNYRANALIQAFIFVVAGAAVALIFGPALNALGILTPRLVDGLVVLACLPTTIGSGVALTQAADGNVAVALFHAVFSNLAGIAITPALIFAYLGANAGGVGGVGEASGAVAKLVSTVLVPVLAGMAIRAVPGVGDTLSSKPIKGKLKLTSDLIILAIIYNTFCNTFKTGFGVATGEVTALGLVLAVFLVVYKAAVFLAARAVGLSNKDVVAAVFMGSQKTLAFGLPLIKALFESSPDLVSFCLPALVYHPMQIALGSALVPRLREFVAKGEGIPEENASRAESSIKPA